MFTHVSSTIIPDQVLWTHKQSGVCRIIKVCKCGKEHARMSAVNRHSQNSVRNYSGKFKKPNQNCKIYSALWEIVSLFRTPDL